MKTLNKSDHRFERISRNPCYKKPRKFQTKVKIDRRFKDIFNDSISSASIDKYGRPAKNLDRQGFRLQNNYSLDNEDSKEEFSSSYDAARNGGFQSSSDEDEIHSSSSSYYDSKNTFKGDNLEADVNYIELAPTYEFIERGSETNRLAVVNLDWDNLKSEDIFAALNGFVGTGLIKSVVIYVSEYGKKMIEREALNGPPSEIFAKGVKEYRESMSQNSDDKNVNQDTQNVIEQYKFERIDSNVNDGIDELNEDVILQESLIEEQTSEEYDMSKLRRYQLNRLRYYYAIVVCDSKETAKLIYSNCDGTEYEASANFFDLRFVPECTIFSDDDIRDSCFKVSDSYRPIEFITDALQNSVVKLTWDMDDSRRKHLVKQSFQNKELNEEDFVSFLASSDSDQETDFESLQKKYRDLLDCPLEDVYNQNNSEQNKELQIQFAPALSMEVDSENETTIEKYLRKQKERKSRNMEGFKEENKIEIDFDDPFFKTSSSKNSNIDIHQKRKKCKLTYTELENIVEAHKDSQSVMDKHFDIKAVQRSEKSKGRAGKSKNQHNEGAQTNVDIDVKDTRFSDIYNSHQYAIDPSNPHYRKTKIMEKILKEKQFRQK